MPSTEEPGNEVGSDSTRSVHDAETIFRGPDAEREPTPAGVASLDELSRSLVEVALVKAAELEHLAALCAEGVIGLSRALVKVGKLTLYRAAAIYEKKSRGLSIGNDLILEKLAQGGIGVVFRARHRRLGRVGALKILPPCFARDRASSCGFAARLRLPAG